MTKSKKSVAMIVMDGVGLRDNDFGNAVNLAYTPTLDALLLESPNARLKAHGTAVGLPTDDDMGNSEVGHNAMGCGQIYSQGAKLVNHSIETGAMFESAIWKRLTGNLWLRVLSKTARTAGYHPCRSLTPIQAKANQTIPENPAPSPATKPERCCISL